LFQRKLRIRQLEPRDGPVLLVADGCRLGKIACGVGNPVLRPTAPSAIQEGLAAERAVRKVADHPAEVALRLKNQFCGVGLRGGVKRLELQLAQSDPGDVQGGIDRLRRDKCIEAAHGLLRPVLTEHQVDGFEERVALSLGGKVRRKVVGVGVRGFLQPAKPLENLPLDRVRLRLVAPAPGAQDFQTVGGDFQGVASPVLRQLDPAQPIGAPPIQLRWQPLRLDRPERFLRLIQPAIGQIRLAQQDEPAHGRIGLEISAGPGLENAVFGAQEGNHIAPGVELLEGAGLPQSRRQLEAGLGKRNHQVGEGFHRLGAVAQGQLRFADPILKEIRLGARLGEVAAQEADGAAVIGLAVTRTGLIEHGPGQQGRIGVSRREAFKPGFGVGIEPVFETLEGAAEVVGHGPFFRRTGGGLGWQRRARRRQSRQQEQRQRAKTGRPLPSNAPM